MIPGFLKGVCSQTVYIDGMGAIGSSGSYFIQLPEGNYKIKHGLFGSWVNVSITSGQTTTHNF